MSRHLALPGSPQLTSDIGGSNDEVSQTTSGNQKAAAQQELSEYRTVVVKSVACAMMQPLLGLVTRPICQTHHWNGMGCCYF